MKVELVKKIDGAKTFWVIKVDGWPEEALFDEKEAHTKYHDIIDAIKNGVFKKEVVVESVEI